MARTNEPILYLIKYLLGQKNENVLKFKPFNFFDLVKGKNLDIIPTC